MHVEGPARCPRKWPMPISVGCPHQLHKQGGVVLPGNTNWDKISLQISIVSLWFLIFTSGQDHKNWYVIFSRWQSYQMVLSTFEQLKPPPPKVVIKGKNWQTIYWFKSRSLPLAALHYRHFVCWTSMLIKNKISALIIVETTQKILLFETANML